MIRGLKIVSCLWLIFPLSCSTPSKNIKSALEKTRHELEQATQEVPPPHLPEEKSIRQDLERFKSILTKKKSLSPEDWKLHDRLFDYYIQLKEGVGAPNKIFISAHNVVDLDSEAAHIPLDEYKFIEFWKGHGKK